MPTKSYAPVLPPPQVSTSLLGWLRVHLFSTWYNTLLTLGLVGGLVLVLPPLWHWLFAVAHWQAVTVNVRRFLGGVDPSDQVWPPGVVRILGAWVVGRREACL